MAIATTINEGASPLGSTELDNEMEHNCKMSKKIYTSFGLVVLGLNHDSWATACTECAFHNLLIQDIDAMMYNWDTDNYVNGVPVLLPEPRLDMAHILARLTLLLTGADVCTLHIINSVWGDNKNARLALGGPRGELSLIRRKILRLSKVAINMVHIWMTNPSTNFLAPNSVSFQQLPPTVQRLLLQPSKKSSMPLNQFRLGPQPPNYSPTISADTLSLTHFRSRRKLSAGIVNSYCIMTKLATRQGLTTEY